MLIIMVSDVTNDIFSEDDGHFAFLAIYTILVLRWLHNVTSACLEPRPLARSQRLTRGMAFA